MRARLFIAAMVFWPWLFIAVEFVILLWAGSHGCKISAAGPAACDLWGYDIGEQLYGLWAIGYHIAFSLLWVFPTALIWAIVELVRFTLKPSRPKSRGEKD